ncbi:transposase [Bacillus dakarensis]|uniref:transposase n=1 Tax=Robertmurraya dakarensis TaxID=1926278 RepID=UPI000980D07B|nr:transposase [Bacillus dakarensis]
MPRKPQFWYPGAKYHIYNRGNRKSTLFYDDEDRMKYLTITAETKEKYPFHLNTYCLMTNHIHLNLETIKDPPGKIMHAINVNYAKYFNKKYDLTGHVFENRYNYEFIDSVEYELDVSKYIHLNPLQAGMVQKMEDYPWSSYRAYILKEHNPLVTTDHLLSYFPDPPEIYYHQYLKSAYTFSQAMSVLRSEQEI